MPRGVQVAADARIRGTGGRTDGHGCVGIATTATAARAAAGRGVPHVLVAVRVQGSGTAVVCRRGRGSGLGTVLVVVRRVGVVVVVVVRTVVDLAAGRGQGRVVGRLLRGPRLVQVVVRVRRHAQRQGEASVRGR